jgi:hypothetical protein
MYSGARTGKYLDMREFLCPPTLGVEPWNIEYGDSRDFKPLMTCGVKARFHGVKQLRKLKIIRPSYLIIANTALQYQPWNDKGARGNRVTARLS